MGKGSLVREWGSTSGRTKAASRAAEKALELGRHWMAKGKAPQTVCPTERALAVAWDGATETGWAQDVLESGTAVLLAMSGRELVRRWFQTLVSSLESLHSLAQS